MVVLGASRAKSGLRITPAIWSPCSCVIDDGLGRRQRPLDLLLLRREVGLLDAAAEEFVHLKVHAGVDHDRAVGIDDLIGRARLDARLARARP